MSQPKVYIILLNWNGWEDTIECLESIFRNSYLNYQVIVCDNNSSDESLKKIKDWADGKVIAGNSADERVSQHTVPSVLKPIPYVEYTREQVDELDESYIRDPRLILIQTGENLGFAGGNNVGIRYALAQKDFAFIWLLNNDTVIHQDALLHLINRASTHEDIGICGSTLLYYHNPTVVQALGGASYNRWLGRAWHLGAYTEWPSKLKITDIEKNMNYVVGASMLVSKRFIEDVGVMCEDYFLYYEELDWAARGASNYTLAYAPESIVFHKEGASTGRNNRSSGRSMLSDYYLLKNKIVVTKKHFCYALPFVYLDMIINIFKRVRRGQWVRAKMVLKILFNRPMDISK